MDAPSDLIVQNLLPQLLHHLCHVVDVVYGQQRGAKGLICLEEVV